MTALEQAKALVLVTLRDESPLTIPQIQKRWNRSPAYVYGAVDSLVENGLVVCAGWMSPNGHSTRSYKLNPARAPQVSSETREWMNSMKKPADA